jgi:hypothetical protein
VPYALAFDGKRKCVEPLMELLEMLRLEELTQFYRIITGDKPWFYEYDLSDQSRHAPMTMFCKESVIKDSLETNAESVRADQDRAG